MFRMSEDAPQRRYELREMFNALRWMARAGASWRMLPTSFPPWERVYQQTQRWLNAGCFEAMVNDLRSVLRVAQERQGQPSAVILDGRTLQSTCESGPLAGYDGQFHLSKAACTRRKLHAVGHRQRARLLRQGASHAMSTTIFPRAVACVIAS